MTSTRVVTLPDILGIPVPTESVERVSGFINNLSRNSAISGAQSAVIGMLSAGSQSQLQQLLQHRFASVMAPEDAYSVAVMANEVFNQIIRGHLEAIAASYGAQTPPTPQPHEDPDGPPPKKNREEPPRPGRPTLTIVKNQTEPNDGN